MSPRWSWSNIATVLTLIVVAVIEAAQQAIKPSPDFSRHFPSWLASSNWNYLQLVLLVVAGAFWIIGHLPNRRPLESNTTIPLDSPLALKPQEQNGQSPLPLFSPVPIPERELFKRSTEAGNVKTAKWLRALEQQWRECGHAVQDFAAKWNRYLRDLEVIRGRMGLVIDLEREIRRSRETFADEIETLRGILGRKAQIEILTRPNNAEVPVFQEARGFIHPQKHPLHVRVQAQDKKWYRQPDPAWDGDEWKVICQMGDPDGQLGGSYNIIAVWGVTPAQSVLDTLPDDIVVSKVITVRRTEPNGAS